jgi:hypothetical protein
MKKTITTIVVACAVMLLGLTANANATTLTVGDSYYIGRIVDGIPSNEASEVKYINSLLGMATNAAVTPCSLDTSENCDRLGSTINVTGFSSAVVTGSQKDTSGDNTIDATGFTYVLAKYDAGDGGSFVWYVAGLTDIEVPANLGTCGSIGCGLSHTTLFNPTSVPDGGLTLMLLGVGLVGIETLRRKFSA